MPNPRFYWIFFASALALLPPVAQAQSLTLAAAEARLEAGNREIIAARQLVELAGAGTLLAGAVPNPTVTASMASINASRGIGAGRLQDKQVDSILRIDQLLERGGKRDLRIATADAQVLATQRDLDEIRRQQRLALNVAYFDLKLALEKLQIIRDTARLHEQSVAANQRRFESGDVAETEVVRLRIEALRAANDARSAEADVVRARQALGVLIGVESGTPEFVPSDAWPMEFPASAATEASAERIETRADVRAAQARVEVAERSRELARSLRTRDVSVGAQVERFPPDPGLSMGFSISLPLFVRYGFEGELAVAESGLTSAMAARSRQVAIAMTEVRRAQNDLRAADERRRRLNEDLLPQARKALASAEFAYQRGATGLLDLLDVRRTQRALELEAVSAAADFAKARAAWFASQFWNDEKS